MPAFGQIHDEPAEVYHQTDAVSSHRLSDFARPNVPLLYYKKHVEKSIAPDESTAAQAFGEYFHCLALEGENVADARFAVSPKFDRRTKQGKADSEAFALGNAGKTIVDAEDFALAWQMVKSIRAKKTAAALFAQGKPEVVFRHQLASFAIQSRVDWFNGDLDEWKRPTIVDLKSIDRIANFERQFLKFGYYRQMAFYQLTVFHATKGEGAFPKIKMVVVEKEQPGECAVFEPDEVSMDIGRNEVLADLARLKECYDTNNWPGEPDEARPVTLPEWKQMKCRA